MTGYNVTLQMSDSEIAEALEDAGYEYPIFDEEGQLTEDADYYVRHLDEV